MTDVDVFPVPDALLRLPFMRGKVKISVLGITIQYKTNSNYVMQTVRDAFAAWMGCSTAEASQATIRIIVHDQSDATGEVRHISTNDGRLFVHAPGCFAVVDPDRKESVAYVTAALVADTQLFKTAIVEAITFALLAGFDRHPLHAAALVQDRRALLLAAPSGTGKSTLAYLAHARGVHVMSDDRVWVQREPHLRIWGTTSSVALHAAALPGLDGANLARRSDDKLVLPLEHAKPILSSDHATVCILARGSFAALERLGAADVEVELARQLAPGFDRFPSRQHDVMRAISARGGWRLTLSPDPLDAIPFLHRMLDDP